MKYDLNGIETSRFEIWGLLDGMPEGTHDVIGNIRSIAMLKSVLNSYVTSYIGKYGMVDSPSGWPMVKITSGGGAGRMQVKAYEHVSLSYEEVNDIGRPGRKQSPFSVRGNTIEACRTAANGHRAMIDRSHNDKLSYIRTLVSIFNTDNNTRLSVSMEKNGDSRNIVIINKDALVTVPVSYRIEDLLPESLVNYIRGEKDQAFTIEEAEYAQLKTDLQEILNRAKQRFPLI